MIRGMYTAATGMVAELHRQDVIANNLANVDTVGFKGDYTVSVPFGEMLLNAYNRQGVRPVGGLGLGVQATSEYIDTSEGSLVETGIMYDLAIGGQGYFVVETPAGERYTRAGNFKVDAEGYLTTRNGWRVLGENGPIQVTGRFEVNQDGEIFIDGVMADRLRIVNPYGLRKEGESLFTATGINPANGIQIFQGTVERSNVNAIRQMIEMINVTRSYETNQRALTAHDETLGKAVNEIAR